MYSVHQTTHGYLLTALFIRWHDKLSSWLTPTVLLRLSFQMTVSSYSFALLSRTVSSPSPWCDVDIFRLLQTVTETDLARLPRALRRRSYVQLTTATGKRIVAIVLEQVPIAWAWARYRQRGVSRRDDGKSPHSFTITKYGQSAT